MKYVPIALGERIQNEARGTQHHLKKAPGSQTRCVRALESGNEPGELSAPRGVYVLGGNRGGTAANRKGNDVGTVKACELQAEGIAHAKSLR